MTNEPTAEEQSLIAVFAEWQERYARAQKAAAGWVCDVYAYPRPCGGDQGFNLSFMNIVPSDKHEPSSQA